MSKYGLDKFYTKKDIVKSILKEIDISYFNSIIEPSAGSGSFSDELNCIAYDIKPENDSIIKQDFLTLEVKETPPVLVIGNPPFGRNGSLALKFIKHSAIFADTIAFILPKSFKKDSFYYKIPLNFWKTKEIDLDDNSFFYNGENTSVPCVFQIYEKRDINRIKPKKTEPKSFSFVKKNEANVSIRRVGVYAGKAFSDIEKSEQSHYFIKVKDPDSFIEKVNNVKWEHNNTVGPRSISKPELISKID